MALWSKIANTDRHAPYEPDPIAHAQARRDLDAGNKEAIVKFKELAAEGSVLSMLDLARVYKEGGCVSADATEAERYLRQAAHAGSYFAYYCLGVIYLKQKRYDEALSALSYASGKGYAPATHILGRIYCEGIGITKDKMRGEKYLARASAGGSLIARAALAHLLMQDRKRPLRMARGGLLLLATIPQILVAAIFDNPGSDRMR